MREKITVKIQIDFSGRMNTQTANRGDQVFVGTGQGNVFAIDTNAGNVVEQPVKLPKPSPGTQMTGGTILRIVALDTSSIFGVLLAAIEKKADGSAPLGVPAVQNYILRLDNGTWSPTSATGLPNELLFGFVVLWRRIRKFHGGFWRRRMTLCTSAGTTVRLGNGHRLVCLDARIAVICALRFSPWEARPLYLARLVARCG